MRSTLLKALTIAGVLSTTFTMANTAFAAEKIIKIDGSSTEYPITEAVAEEFQKAQKGQVTVGEERSWHSIH